MAGHNEDGRDSYRSELDRLHLAENQLDVVRVRLIPDVPLFSDRPITSSDDAIGLIADELKDWDREAFCILSLDVKGRVLNMNIVSLGTLTETAVHPREVYKPVLAQNGASVIFLHNHPSSGDPAPSSYDIETTRRLVEAADILGIQALDHIVVGKNGVYFSFKENDLIFNEPAVQRWKAAEETAAYVADGGKTDSTTGAKKGKKQSFREQVAQSFIQSLQEAPREWTKTWASNETGRPRNLVTGRAYRGLNMAYLKYIENRREFHDPRWLTYRQAVDAGYQIPKGTKMTPVEYFFMYDNLEKKTIPWNRYNALSDDEKFERVNTANGKLAEPGVSGTGIKPRYELRHRDHYVFNASQLEGVPEFQFDRTVNDIAPSAVVDAVASGMQVPIEHKEQDRAFYTPVLDRITLPLRSQFDSDYDYQATALHELGHATGHESRLDRNIRNRFGTPEYAFEELIAEITSCYMGEYIPQPMSEADMDNHLAYVQGWIKEIQSDNSYLFGAIREAERAADYMIEKGSLEELKEKALLQQKESEAAQKQDEPPSQRPEVSAVAEHQTEAYGNQSVIYEEKLQTGLYQDMPPEKRPPYRIAIYTADFTPAQIEAIAGPDVIEAPESKMTVLEYLKTEHKARLALRQYQSTASYQRMLDGGEIPVSQIALEYLQYDSSGDLISEELVDYTPKPVQFDLKHRSMDLYEENGRYCVRFYNDADLKGEMFCFDEAAKSFLSGFKPYLRESIDARLESLLGKKLEPGRVYQSALDDYVQGAHAVLDGALPAGWRLSYRESAQTRDFLQHEIQQLTGSGREDQLVKDCIRDVLAQRGLAFRTIEEAQDHYRAEVNQKWQRTMMDTIVRARSTLVYAGDEI